MPEHTKRKKDHRKRLYILAYILKIIIDILLYLNYISIRHVSYDKGRGDNVPIPQLSDSNKLVLEVLWEHGSILAKDVAAYLDESNGYTKGTTYKLLGRLIQKGFIRKKESSFICVPVYTRDEILANETEKFLDRFFEGSFQNLVVEFIEKKRLSEEDCRAIRLVIDREGGQNK